MAERSKESFKWLFKRTIFLEMHKHMCFTKGRKLIEAFAKGLGDIFTITNRANFRVLHYLYVCQNFIEI